MKRITTILLVLVLALGLFSTALPVGAQDAMMTHVCDSTLIALLYIAEHDYGFNSMFDLSTYEKGQYAPLFDAMMAMMGDEMMEEEAMMTEEAMMEEGDDMMENMVMLTPGHIEGEDVACSDLRAELDAFLYKALSAEMMMEPSS